MKLIPMALDALRGTASSRISGMKATAKCFAIIGVLGVISAVFLLIALTTLLADEVGVIYACLIMSALFAALALIVLMIHHRGHARKSDNITASRAALSSKTETTSVKVDAVALAEAFVKGYLNRRS